MKHLPLFRIFAFVMGLILLLPVLFAIAPPDTEIYGNVRFEMENGTLVLPPTGTTIVALLSGMPCGETKTKENGVYGLLSCNQVGKGKSISFMVDGKTVSSNLLWGEGAFYQHDIVVPLYDKPIFTEIPGMPEKGERNLFPFFIMLLATSGLLFGMYKAYINIGR